MLRKPSVAAGVDRDLAAIAKVDKDLARSALAETARVLAGELDDPENSATSKSMCARALSEAMTLLRDRLPDDNDEKDRLDGLHDRHTKRRRRAAA